MEEIYNLINDPIVILIGVILVLIIDKGNKIKELFPNAKKHLERLDLSKDFINDCDNKELIDFYHSEKENHNFYNLTGMANNKTNQKLLSHYNEIKHQMTWTRFTKIKQYLELDSFTIIKTKFEKFKDYFFIVYNFLLVIIIFLLMDFSGGMEKPYPLIIILYFCLIFPMWNLFSKFSEFKIIREYNEIVSKKNTEIK